jgi:hypothetical protein
MNNDLKTLKVWTDDKEEYMLLLTLELNWFITKNHELLHESQIEVMNDDEKPEIIEEFTIYHPAIGRTTYFLREFCNEYHPEVDFDTEFETHKPGVFGKYQEKFGHDYSDYDLDQKYQILDSALAEMGYKLPFEQSKPLNTTKSTDNHLFLLKGTPHEDSY